MRPLQEGMDFSQDCNAKWVHPYRNADSLWSDAIKDNIIEEYFDTIPSSSNNGVGHIDNSSLNSRYVDSKTDKKSCNLFGYDATLLKSGRSCSMDNTDLCFFCTDCFPNIPGYDDSWKSERLCLTNKTDPCFFCTDCFPNIPGYDDSWKSERLCLTNKTDPCFFCTSPLSDIPERWQDISDLFPVCFPVFSLLGHPRSCFTLPQVRRSTSATSLMGEMEQLLDFIPGWDDDGDDDEFEDNISFYSDLQDEEDTDTDTD